ncbi:unnamed protein product [Colias eurytheme]|nr:unnamed protein product [Colias eurytheme]
MTKVVRDSNRSLASGSQVTYWVWEVIRPAAVSTNRVRAAAHGGSGASRARGIDAARGGGPGAAAAACRHKIPS